MTFGCSKIKILINGKFVQLNGKQFLYRYYLEFMFTSCLQQTLRIPTCIPIPREYNMQVFFVFFKIYLNIFIPCHLLIIMQIVFLFKTKITIALKKIILCKTKYVLNIF